MNNRAIALLIGIISAILGVVALLVDGSTIGLFAGLVGLATSAVISAQNDVVHSGSGNGATASMSTSAVEASGSQASVTEERDDQQLTLANDRISSLESELKTLRAELSSPPEERSALTDPESQLYSEAYFRVALDARIAAARRHLRPVAIALLEVNEGPASSLTPVPPARAAESIRQTIRDADTACRLTDGTFAIILEDTPENGAVWTVERVRRNLVSRFGNHTMWAGVACYPAHAFSTDDLLSQANEALVSAREWQQDRIEVAISE
ncbi:MAG: diguanylate cyclase [Microthrixaceae bacterium]